ncbi:hypothetical protein [Streptomyces sp. NPDC057877]|uniref:hypothetical protein n=1 Tax=Streptomyces sp. NPDC057877 TaxID=3346269 RepID=UPI0036B38AEC
MTMEMTMTTRCAISVRWQHLRVVIVVVLVILGVLTQGQVGMTLIDPLLQVR